MPSTRAIRRVVRPLMPKKPLLPDERGYFGAYGGRYVPEILIPNIEQLSNAFEQARSSEDFWRVYLQELREFSGRSTPITPCRNLSKYLGGAQIFLKREDLNQTGAHKVNNVIGQGLLAKMLGKKRIIAETGAGQHVTASDQVRGLQFSLMILNSSSKITVRSLKVFPILDDDIVRQAT